MSQRVLAEAVTQYLEAGAGREGDYLALLGNHSVELASLIGVIRLLRATLLPVSPSPEFIAALGARLASVPVEDLPAASSDFPTRLALGAVAVGSLLSAAALLVYARSRAARAA
jgi:hypothetical protein